MSFEKLDSLETRDTDSSEKEKQIMEQLFGAAPKTKKKSMFKLLLYMTVLFILLANPWTDGLFCKVPYCGTSDISVLATKTLLFVLLSGIAYLFLC